MDFSLTSEQQDLRELAGRIFNDTLTSEHLRSLEQQDDIFDETLWQSLAEAGLLGIGVDENYGGMALGFEALCLLIEQAGASVATLPLISSLVSGALGIQRYGSEAQKAALLPGIAEGKLQVTVALQEEGWDLSLAPETKAKKVKDGWLINGVKNFVPWAKTANKIIIPVTAEDGLRLFLLDPTTHGVAMVPQTVTSGEPQAQIILKDVRLADDHIMAKPIVAEQALRWLNQLTIVAWCAFTLGVTEKATQMTAAYTTERHQFDRPVATFQAVAHRAADCYMKVTTLRLLTQQAIYLINSGEEAEKEVQCAKIWAGDTAHYVSQSSQHMHGGTGVDRDYPLFRYCLWCKHCELILGGSSQLLAELGRNIAQEHLRA